MEQQQSAVHSGALGPVVSEHTKVTASLGLAGQPSLMAVHDRSLVGGDVDLAPTAGHQNTVNLILVAGDKRAVFTVHSALLCYYSSFFHDVLEEGGVTIKARSSRGCCAESGAGSRRATLLAWELMDSATKRKSKSMSGSSSRARQSDSWSCTRTRLEMSVPAPWLHLSTGSTTDLLASLWMAPPV